MYNSMTMEIEINREIFKSEGFSGAGLTGEMGSGGDFVPPYGMPGAYKYKVRKKKEENVITNSKTK